MRRLSLLIAFICMVLPFGAARAASFTVLTDVRLAMDDGVKVAGDVYVPTVADRDADGLYPCVVELTPYRKESRAAEGSSYLPDHGIALIEVDARGTGGSSGEYDIVFSVREQQDTVAWIDWAAETATKDGKPLAADGSNKLCEEQVGMYGGSYSGIIQYLVASLPLHDGDFGYGRLPTGSPHLAAIAPMRAYGDLYRDIVYQGGIAIASFGAIWSAGTARYYGQPPQDMPGSDAQQAWADHMTKNDPLLVNYLERPYADATFTSNGTEPAYTQNIYEDSSALPRIENLRVPTLHLAGLFDAFTRGQLRMFTEAYALERARGDRGPNFLIAGPWNHSGTHFITPNEGFVDKLGDWYQWWLEDRANGGVAPAWITGGDRVTYFQMLTGKVDSQTPADGEWRTANEWPPPQAHAVKLHLEANDVLTGPLNTALYGGQGYVYTPTTGKGEAWSRWDDAAGVPVTQPQIDQRVEEGQGATFQTQPLASALSIDGPINLHMLATTTGYGTGTPGERFPGLAQMTPAYHDTDWVAKLSDVAPDGTTTLVTQGYLRASHRAVDPTRSQFLDGELIAPYHPHTFDSVVPPGDNLQAYDVEIWPTAKTWAPGHRLRLDITSADTPNHLNLLKPALNTIYYGQQRDSYLTLPVTP